MLTLRRRLFPAKDSKDDKQLELQGGTLSIGQIKVPLENATLVSGSGNNTTNDNSHKTTNNIKIKKLVIGHSVVGDESHRQCIGSSSTNVENSDGGDILGVLTSIPRNDPYSRARTIETYRIPTGEHRSSMSSDVWSTRSAKSSVRSGRKTPMRRRVLLPQIHCQPVTIGVNETICDPADVLIVLVQDLKLPDSLHQDIKAYMCSSRFTDTLDLFFESDYTICLWNPYNNISMDRQLQENYCILGDVGIFNSEGGFDVLFNIFMSVEENLAMNYDPPATFVPLQLNTSGPLHAQRPTPQGDGYYLSENFEREKEETGQTTYTFQSIKAPPRPGGAILVLPEGCTKRFIQPNIVKKIEQYLDVYAESWYDPESYSDKLRALPNGSLQLIRTCYRSNLWAAAVLPSKRYRPGMSCARLKRSTTNPRSYHWDEAYRKSILVNTGSSKKNVEDLHCTIAVEVYSIYHHGPEIEYISSPVNRQRSQSSVFSFRSRIAQSFTTINELVRR